MYKLMNDSLIIKIFKCHYYWNRNYILGPNKTLIKFNGFSANYSPISALHTVSCLSRRIRPRCSPLLLRSRSASLNTGLWRPVCRFRPPRWVFAASTVSGSRDSSGTVWVYWGFFRFGCSDSSLGRLENSQCIGAGIFRSLRSSLTSAQSADTPSRFLALSWCSGCSGTEGTSEWWTRVSRQSPQKSRDRGDTHHSCLPRWTMACRRWRDSNVRVGLKGRAGILYWKYPP